MANSNRARFFNQINKHKQNLKINDKDFLNLCYELKEYFGYNTKYLIYNIKYDGWEFEKGKFNVMFHTAGMYYSDDESSNIIHKMAFRNIAKTEIENDLDKFANKYSFTKNKNIDRYTNGKYSLYIEQNIMGIYIVLAISDSLNENTIFKNVNLI